MRVATEATVGRWTREQLSSAHSLNTYGNLDLVTGCPLGATIGLTGPASNFYNRILGPGRNATLGFQAYEDTTAPLC